ncbi:MAG: hypothetical protein WCX64_02590 [Candidatus Micrarchaeia archaeon]
MPGEYQRTSESPSLVQTLVTEVPRILVLVGLLLILLVLLTKFRWIHCSQVLKIGPVNLPTNWCEVYCTYLNGPASKMAIVYGDEGIGDPDKLSTRIQQERLDQAKPYTVPVMLRIEDFAYESIKGYDVVFFERARRITPAQMNAVKKYIASGGVIIWIGDAGTEYYYQQIDIDQALALNVSEPGYYEAFMQDLNTTNAMGGFGPLSSYLGVKYSSLFNATSNVTMVRVATDNLMVSDLVDEITFKADVPFAVVTFNPSGASQVTKLKVGSLSYPAIVEVRNPRVSAVYVAFPLEDSPSKGLINNILDYLVLC